MRLKTYTLIALLIAALSGCGRHGRDQNATERDQPDRDSAAFKAGEVAQELSKEAGKAAKAAGREIGKDAHAMQEGWNQAQRDDREKKKKR
jgi:predicted small lipoprotein YifL